MPLTEHVHAAELPRTVRKGRVVLSPKLRSGRGGSWMARWIWPSFSSVPDVPALGQRAAAESRVDLMDLISGAERLVLFTGLGGGTGTGATPAIAKMARAGGVLVQVVATLPLRLEKRRREQAQAAVDQLAAAHIDLTLHDHEDLVIRHAGHASLDDYFLKIDQWVVEDFLTREIQHAQ